MVRFSALSALIALSAALPAFCALKSGNYTIWSDNGCSFYLEKKYDSVYCDYLVVELGGGNVVCHYRLCLRAAMMIISIVVRRC
jgi:hypothetical protein